MAEEMRALYLIAGTDGAKIDATRARLRARAEREAGSDALEVFEPGEGRGMPDHEALLLAIPAMSLMQSRRYLLVDGVERWRDRQIEAVAAAVGELPPDLTLVLISRGKTPAKLSKAVKAAKGEIHEFEAPKAREMPRALVANAQALGFRLDPAAARLLVERMGASPVRLQHELERLALWAGEGGEVSAADLGSMIADTSEAAVWSLSDALLERDAAAALRIGERLIDQGENVTGLIYGLASRLRGACFAAGQLEQGIPPKQVESSLKMHPYAAKLLVGRLRDTNVADLRMATEALADLELWCRGGADYGDELAFTLTLQRCRWPPRRRAKTKQRQGGERERAPHVTERRRRACAGLQPPTRRRCERLWTSCVRRCSCAWRPSARPCRSSRRGRAPRLAIAPASPPSTALSRRRKWVLTVLVSSRFSARSRSLRRIRFFCEAMLAMSQVPGLTRCQPQAAADYSD